jgi:uncharacterized protein (TIGR03437 family)
MRKVPNAVLNAIVLHTTGIAILALAFPLAASANVTGTPTLSANMALSLDTGTTSSSGGDVLWSGATMTPQGKATAYSLGPVGSSAFAVFTQSTLSSFGPLYTSAAIPASTLVVGEVFAVHTNGGNYAAVLVTAVSGSSITLQFTTFGVNSGPTITAVQNNYGNIPAGFANSGIAQGALAQIYGTGLSNTPTAQITSLQSPSAAGGLPTSLNGATVKVTSGGTTVTPAFYYAGNTVMAVVLPSNTPVGTAQMTVTYNGQTSAPFSFQVVQSTMGFDTYGGTPEIVAQNPLTGALYSYASSVPPGAEVAFWGSGLGADPAVDTTAVPGAFNKNGLAHVYVGGVDAPIAYQGESGPGYPGVDEVFVTIPMGVPTGCNVSVVGVSASGVPTNFTTMPIGNGPCSDPVYGITGAQLTSLSSQTNVANGTVLLEISTSPATSGSGTTTNDIAVASFQSYTGYTFGSTSGLVSLGGCTVNQTVSSSGSSGTTTGLDAGTIKVSGPGLSSTTLMSEAPFLAGFYEAQLAAGSLSSGTYTFTGSGGANVGPFTAMITFPNPPLTWTNQAAAATVMRSAGLPVTWTGGATGTYVEIGGNSSSSSGSAFGSFTCIAPVSAGSFTVPSYVLAALPAGMGSVTVENETNFSSFTATGLNNGFAAGFVAVEVNSTYN